MGFSPLEGFGGVRMRLKMKRDSPSLQASHGLGDCREMRAMPCATVATWPGYRPQTQLKLEQTTIDRNFISMSATITGCSLGTALLPG
jgi:hypothetical protein